MSRLDIDWLAYELGGDPPPGDRVVPPAIVCGGEPTAEDQREIAAFAEYLQRRKPAAPRTNGGNNA